jgi:SAM-dependent methyltransferase
VSNDFLDEFYDDYPRIEEAFRSELDKSLRPRGPEFLFEMVARLGLPEGASVVDLGCGEGEHAIELAKRFAFKVQGIDPVPRHIELGQQSAEQLPGIDVLFEPGSAEAIPVADGTVDLIWCREVLYHVPSLEKAFSECYRILRPGGRMLIYHNFGNDQRESGNHGPAQVEAAFLGAGLAIDQQTEMGSEFGEYAEEQRGEGGRRLIHAARLLREPERYIAQFGRRAYDIMLDDCMWHVNRMIGRLNGRIYLLRKP